MTYTPLTIPNTPDRRAIKYIYVVFYYTFYSIKPRNGVTHDRQQHIIYTGLEKQSTWTQDRRTVVEHSTVDRAGLKMQANDFLSLPPNAHTHAKTQARFLPSFRPPHTIHACSYPTPPQVHTHPFPLQVHLLLPIHNPTNNTITRSFSKSVKTSVTMVCPCPAPTLAVARLNPQTHRGALGNTCTCTHATLRTAGKSSRENVTFVYV